jgi:leucyl-tRNA synthetase
MKYDFAAIESRWQQYWAEHKTFRALNPGDAGFDAGKPKYYVLDMFPYPSGVGLHVGHPLGYIATDIVARYKRMRDFNVLHPMGYDAFGLPAEQFAVEHGVHPRVTTQQNIANMTRQLKRLGLSYDWDRCVSTTDVDYYKWTQWIFLQLYHSWYDPARKRARPTSELRRMLESGVYYVGPDGELVDAPGDGLDGVAGSPIGARKWHELHRDERRAVIDSHRLAYIAEVPVNWCPALGTVLANEEVTNDGRSERGNHPVYRRPLKQWMLRITAYAERLLDDLDNVDWPESIKLMQRNWIGRSEGARIDFPIAYDKHGSTADQIGQDAITVFTTRPDTIFGATYMVLAPEHPLVEILTTPDRADAVDAYCRAAAARGDRERLTDHDEDDAPREKTGVFTGAYVLNPANNEKIPIWVADYVLMGYGTGAIMAVPAHDQRDFEFACQMALPIRDVVYPPALTALRDFVEWYDHEDAEPDDLGAALAAFVALRLTEPKLDARKVAQRALKAAAADRAEAAGSWQARIESHAAADARQLMHAVREGQVLSLLGSACEEPGVCVNSAGETVSLDGLPTPRARTVMTDYLSSRGLGQRHVQYKLRDWLFSRQRYWGEPFPIVHGPDGEVVAIKESRLPVELQELDDFRPTASDDPNAPPQPPLARAPESWKYIEQDGVRYTREFNTMPQWAGSCWYFLRFIDPTSGERFVNAEAERYWMGRGERPDGSRGPGGVDLYVGGAEHAVLHLLYARFWHKVLYDLGHVSTPEPFGRLFNQGYIQAYAYRDGRGIAVPAEQVEQRDGRFHYQGREVTQEFGKMGKSLRNAVTPDEICEQYGCDTLRLYEMYMGPLDQSKVWRTRDITGVHRFLQRLWRVFVDEQTSELRVTDDEPSEAMLRLLNRTIKRVTDTMENLAFNVAIAALIELNNELVGRERIERAIAGPMVLLLAPLAPHMAEELWRLLGHRRSLAYEPWPAYDASLLIEANIELPVQVNGKLRSRIVVPADADDQQVQQTGLADDKVKAAIEGMTVRKMIVIKGRMLNIVAR